MSVNYFQLVCVVITGVCAVANACVALHYVRKWRREDAARTEVQDAIDRCRRDGLGFDVDESVLPPWKERP